MRQKKLKLSLKKKREDDEGGKGERKTREASAKTGWEDGPIYTASQDPQVDREKPILEESSRSQNRPL